MNSVLRGCGFLFLGVIIFGIGTLFGIGVDRSVLATYSPLPTVADENQNSFSLIAEAWNTIDKSYVDRTAVTNEKLTYGAITGMVDGLGDTGHSRFLTPEMLKEQENYNSGSFEGIGAYVEMKDGYPTIVSPIDGSPAQAAGVQPGDVILAVNGNDITGLPLSEVVQQILGPAGTDVTITFLNPENGERRDTTITRAKIQLENVTWQIIPGTTIAHIRISAFSAGVSDKLSEAIADVTRQGATAVILDLRNNPGGLLSEAVGTASMFLKPGDVVLLKEDAEGNSTAVPAEEQENYTTLPLIVLINQGSASASEIVAGALRDNKRAQLLGEKTFGTGTVLNEFNLSDGSAILLATEKWLTPNNQLIWHQGVEPDQEVKLEYNVSLLQPLGERELSADEIQASEDQQVLKAIELLSK